jgi:CheY-like chemotaxis protein
MSDISTKVPAARVPSGAGQLPDILLVDDQPARLLTYESILSGLNVRCVRASSGHKALQRLLAQEFAVIILDVNMPVMDGFEVARLVREHPRMERTPIIFITGVHVSELDYLKGYEVGAIDYISVPVVPEIRGAAQYCQGLPRRFAREPALDPERLRDHVCCSAGVFRKTGRTSPS